MGDNETWLYNFPLLFLIFFFSFLLIYGGSGVGVFGSWIGFLGLVFSVDGVLGLWCGVFWVFLWNDPLQKNYAIMGVVNGRCLKRTRISYI